MKEFNSFDGINIRYTYQKGKRETLIFLHGWPHNHTVWKKQSAYFLKKGYGVVLVDLRGHGLSDKPMKGKYTFSHFSKDIHGLIKHEQIRDAILIGHSFGGMMILKYLEMFPKSVQGAVCIGTTYEDPLREIPILKHLHLTPLMICLTHFFLKFLEIGKEPKKSIDYSSMKISSDIYYWIQGVRTTPLVSVLACLKEMLRFDHYSVLQKIHIPVLILQGEYDFKTPHNLANMMYKKIKQSKLVIIKKATHDMNLQNPDEVNEQIYKFLTG
tara:strand:+ start:12326 stop:13135 length:810 start_codon:yes stop_codon:yes gene_type:complete